MGSQYKKCVICGTEYKYCPNCDGQNTNPRWMFLFDTENCNDIWEAINAYRTGAKDAKETFKALQKLDLSKEDTFDPIWKGFLKEIREKADVANEPPKKYEKKR